MKPKFLIVGAPKCGTTAMWRYLGQHPDIWMCPTKDLHYFGSDLNFTIRNRHTLSDYLAFFADSTATMAGEASVWYLYSQNAAREIAQFDPNMKIIIMLRDPVAMMYAHYTQMLFNGLGFENQSDFKTALSLEESRSKGENLPPGTPLPEALLYRKIGRYSEQIQRYWDCFSKEQVLILIQEDMKLDTQRVYQETLSFLDVDRNFVADFKRVNTHKVTRFEWVRGLLRMTPQTVKNALPDSTRKRLGKTIRKLNSKHEKRKPLDDELKNTLRNEFRPEVEKLSQMLGRSLWSQAYS